MWDYLRRSRVNGYFVPLSGGIDSCATAIITFSMCRQVAEAARAGSTSSVCLLYRAMLIDIQTIKSLPMQEESQANQKIQSMFLLTRMSSVVGSSIPATWAQRIRQRKPESERKTFQMQLEGKPASRTFFSSTYLFTSYHTDFNMDAVVSAIRDLFCSVTNI